MQISQNASIQKLKELHSKVIQKFNNISPNIETKSDQYIIQRLLITSKLIKLSQNIYKFTQLTSQQKINFIKSYQNDYPALQLQHLNNNKINFKWFHKIIKIISENLQMILITSENDLGTLYVEFQALKVIYTFFIYAITFPQNDIFNLDQSSNQWNQIKKFATTKILLPPEQFKEQLAKTTKILQTTSAIQQQLSQTEGNFSKAMVKSFGMVQYFVSNHSRKKKYMEYKMSMTLQKLKGVLQNTQQGFTGGILNVIFQSVQYVKDIYIPANYEKITQNVIQKWLQSQNNNNIDLDAANPSSDKLDNIFFLDNKKINTKVISNKLIQRKNTNEQQSQNDSQFVLFHIHGGGFIALSPKSHQLYTRRWSKFCDIPIFSINYRKSPQFPFPCAIDDVWQTYNWILNQSHKYYKIKKNKKIIVAGDSAGGNLTVVITNLCIVKNIQIPYTIIPFYPATQMNLNNFTPSYLNSFYDPVLSYEFMTVASLQYVRNPKFQTQKNYLLNPLYTPNMILQKYPPTFIFVGEKDVLHDNSIRFGLKLWKNKVKIETIIYKDMIHGYLNLDFPTSMSCAKFCIDDSIKLINKIMGK